VFHVLKLPSDFLHGDVVLLVSLRRGVLHGPFSCCLVWVMEHI
jgi:hypothetical protein